MRLKRGGRGDACRAHIPHGILGVTSKLAIHSAKMRSIALQDSGQRAAKAGGLTARVLAGLLLGVSGWLVLQAPPPPGQARQTRIRESYARLPLSFEPAGRGEFLSRGGGYTLRLAPAQAVFSLPGSAAPARMRLVGSNAAPRAIPEAPLPGKSHYLLGSDPARWRTNIPHYARVRYENVYPGVDLVFYGNRRQLEYDFVVAPGADPGVIRFEIDGPGPAVLDAAGDLVAGPESRPFRVAKPIVYQEVGGRRRPVLGRFVTQASGQAGFHLAAYDRGRPLVIDPVVIYSTYFGGDRGEDASAVAVDSAGSAYLIGSTNSADLQVRNPLQARYGGGECSGQPCSDVFVAKLNPAGTALVYATYLGGNGEDQGSGIAVDGAGNACLTGHTDSRNFPTANAHQPAFAGGAGFFGGDAFIAKLSPTGGSLVYSTYLGGNRDDAAAGIAVDAGGSAYLTGLTYSPNFPTRGAIQPAFAATGGADAFVTKLSPAGALVYSTFLGGRNDDTGAGIAVDASGNAYAAGSTGSPDFPVARALQPRYGGSPYVYVGDAFVAKLNPSGGALVYSTFLGGSAHDYATAIAVDPAGNAYIAGATQPTISAGNFPTTPGTLQPGPGAVCRGDVDCALNAFIAKINPAGTALVYSTYLSGTSARDGSVFDSASGIAVDAAGNAWVTGTASGPTFPVVNPVQRAPGGGFVARLNTTGSALLFSSHLGGFAGGRGIALDPAGNAYVTGFAGTNFPITPGALQPGFGGAFPAFPSSDGFVVKISPAAAANPLPALTSLSPVQSAAGAAALTLTVNGSGFVPASVARWNARDRATTFVSATQLRAAIPGGDVAARGVALVTVYSPDGGFSNSLAFFIGPPSLSAGGIVSGASFRPAADPAGGVAPGSIVAIFGTELSTATAGAEVVPLPSVLSDTLVTFNNLTAPLFFVSPTQIVAQVPFDLPVGPAGVQVRRGGLPSPPQMVRVAAVSPGIFALSGQGAGAGAILHAADFSLVSDEAPARPGEFVAIYCTGLGALQTPVTTGEVPPVPPPRSLATPEVYIADRPAVVSFSGLAPGLVGVYQVNVQVPTQTPAGTHFVQMLVNGVFSNSVTMAVQ